MGERGSIPEPATFAQLGLGLVGIAVSRRCWLSSRTLNSTLSEPWGLAFLPDGRMLVTQKQGTMVMLSSDGAPVLATLTGIPLVDMCGHGGLLDVAVDPEFDPVTHPWVYWSYAEAGAGGQGTAVARGRLEGSVRRFSTCRSCSDRSPRSRPRTVAGFVVAQREDCAILCVG